MKRRGFLALLGLSALAGQPALAQEGVPPPGSFDDLIRLASSPPAIFQLLREMDALWLIVTLGDPNLPSTGPSAEQRESYMRYRRQLSDIGNLPRIRNNLEANDVRQGLTQLSPSLDQASQRLRQRLIYVGIRESSRLIVVFVRTFRQFSLLLSAASKDNDNWYCHCYGLEVLCSN